MFQKFLSYSFILILILILVSYYTGTKATIGSLGGAIQSIVQTLQGRDKNGNFANYPQ